MRRIPRAGEWRWRRAWLVVAAAAGLAACAEFGAAADTGRLQVRLLSTDAGAPAEPRNIKLAFALPKALEKTLPAIGARHITVHVFPADLSVEEGLQPSYAGAGLMVWHHQRNVFVDVRQPPAQQATGRYALLVRCVSDGRELARGRAEGAVEYVAEKVDVVLVIDSSMSMIRSDPYKKRVEAARGFVEMAARGGSIGRVGIVSFSNRAEVLAPLTGVGAHAAFQKAFKRVKSDGQTNMDDALEAAENVLDEGGSPRRAVVFLTDGRNEPLRYKETHKRLAAEGVPIYAVGLSDRADHALLERMARETGGRAFRAATDRDLLAIYQRVASEIGRQVTLLRETLRGQAVDVRLPVDRSVQRLDLTFNAERDSGRLELQDPQGRRIGPGLATADARASFFEESGCQMARVTRPAAGAWTVSLSTLPTDRAPTLTVTADSDLFLDLFPPQLSGRRLHLGATLAWGSDPVAGGRVRLLDTRGRVPGVELADDGEHNDGAAGDGVFSGWIDLPRDLEGNLSLELRAWGRTRHGETFVRQTGGGLEGIERAREDVGPEMAARLLGGSVDLGVHLPGETAEGRGLLTLVSEHELALAVEPSDLSGKPTGRIPNTALALAPGNGALMRPGKNFVRVRLTVPGGTPPGRYGGRIAVAAGRAHAVLEVSLTVPRVALGLERTELDLGEIRRGREAAAELRIGLDAPRALPLDWEAAGRAADHLTVDRKRGAPLGVGPDNRLTLRARAPLDAAAGTHLAKLRLTCGPASQDLAVRFTVRERPSESVPQAVYEVELPEVVERPPPEPLPAPPDEPKGATGTTQEEPVPAVVPARTDSDEAWKELRPFLFWLVVCALLLLVLLVIAARLLVRHRMARFALASILVNALVLLAFVGLLAPESVQRMVKQPRMVAKLVGIKKDLGLSLSEAEQRLLQRVEAVEQDEQRFTEEKKTVARSSDRPPSEIAQSKPIDTPELVTRREPARAKPESELVRKPLALRRPQLDPEMDRPRPERDQTQPEERVEKVIEDASVERVEVPKDKLAAERRVEAVRPPERSEMKTRRVELSRVARQPQRTALRTRREAVQPDRRSKAEALPEPGRPRLPSTETPTRRTETASEQAAQADFRDPVETQTVAATRGASPDRSLLASTTRDRLATLPVESESATLDRSGVPEKPTIAPVVRDDPSQPEMERVAPGPRPVAEAHPAPSGAAVTGPEPRKVLSERPRGAPARKTARPLSPAELPRHPAAKQREAGPGVLPRLDREVQVANNVRGGAAAAVPEHRLEPRFGPTLLQPVGDAKRIVSARTVPALDRTTTPGRLSVSRVRIDAPAARSVGRTRSVASPVQLAQPEVDLTSARMEPSLPRGRASRPDTPMPMRPSDDAPRAEAVIGPEPSGQAAAEAQRIEIAEPGRLLEAGGPLRAPPEQVSRQAPRPEEPGQAALKTELRLAAMRESLTPRPMGGPARASAGETDLRLSTSTEPGSLSLVVGEVQFASDWNSSPLAVANLLDAFRRRIGASVKVEKRSVPLRVKQIADCQLLFMTGNDPFVLRDWEIRGLQRYLSAGGFLWINDSSREGDDTFDRAVRRELPRLGSGALKRLTRDHPVLRAGYDFSQGVRGYRIPPGDKYRVDYLEGIEVGERLAVLYTRNDYADGMALDPTLNPMRKSLTDLSAEEMQEISIRFGINVIAYALGADRPSLQAKAEGLMPKAPAVDPDKLSLWKDFTGLAPETLTWRVEAWGNPGEVSLAPDGAGGEALRIDLKAGDKHKVAVKYDIPAHEGRRLDLSGVQSILMDVYNGYHGGFRLSLVITTVNDRNAWRDFETRSVYLRPGWNRNLCFPLTGATFKSRETGWKGYDTPLANAGTCGKLSFFFYNGGRIQTAVTVDNIRFERP